MREDISRTGSVRAVHSGDRRSRQVIFQAGVDGNDLGIIPRRDLGIIDIHQQLAAQSQALDGQVAQLQKLRKALPADRAAGPESLIAAASRAP